MCLFKSIHADLGSDSLTIFFTCTESASFTSCQNDYLFGLSLLAQPSWFRIILPLSCLISMSTVSLTYQTVWSAPVELSFISLVKSLTVSQARTCYRVLPILPPRRARMGYQNPLTVTEEILETQGLIFRGAEHPQCQVKSDGATGAQPFWTSDPRY